MNNRKRVLLTALTAILLLLAIFVIIKVPFGPWASKNTTKPTNDSKPVVSSNTSNSTGNGTKTVISKGTGTGTTTAGSTVTGTTTTGSTTAGSTTTGTTKAGSTVTATTTPSTTAAAANFSTGNLIGMNFLQGKKAAEAAGYSISILNLFERSGQTVSDSEVQSMLNAGTLDATISEISVNGDNILVNAMMNE